MKIMRLIILTLMIFCTPNHYVRIRNDNVLLNYREFKSHKNHFK